MTNLLSLIGSLRLFKVTQWDEDSSVTYSQEQREQAPVTEANISTSLREDSVGDTQQHALLLDLDVPAHLIPSSTPGHSHLYVDVRIPEPSYFRLLDALAEAGVIQVGYANASKQRGGTALRLPWVKKEPTQAPTPPPAPALASVPTDPF